LKSQIEHDAAKLDKEIPDISGDEGYPRIYQRNKEEERVKIN